MPQSAVSMQHSRTYQCWNDRCPNYAGTGIILDDRHVFADQAGNIHCMTCHAFVRDALPSSAESPNPAAVVAGAALGFAVGGGVGALLGAALGGLLSKANSR